ncbi:hypothetical protein LY78DRAFT_657179 [Colletotrichum sublineola]|nr:hypothetical protein LY78DRAFT_657179 [Colletotrichum sublineola]
MIDPRGQDAPPPLPAAPGFDGYALHLFPYSIDGSNPIPWYNTELWDRSCPLLRVSPQGPARASPRPEQPAHPLKASPRGYPDGKERKKKKTTAT